MDHQLSFADSEFNSKRRQTRKEKFLGRMEKLIPWSRLIAVIALTLTSMSILIPGSSAQELLVIRPEQRPVQGLPFGEPAGPRWPF